jgi:hypothetical protein
MSSYFTHANAVSFMMLQKKGVKDPAIGMIGSAITRP